MGQTAINIIISGHKITRFSMAEHYGYLIISFLYRHSHVHTLCDKQEKSVIHVRKATRHSWKEITLPRNSKTWDWATCNLLG
jgi:hypothetical protein